MDPTLIANLIRQSPLIAMVVGLLFALKIVRAEWLEREKLWAARLDAAEKTNDDLQHENIVALKEQLKLNIELTAEIKALRDEVKALKGGG